MLAAEEATEVVAFIATGPAPAAEWLTVVDNAEEFEHEVVV